MRVLGSRLRRQAANSVSRSRHRDANFPALNFLSVERLDCKVGGRCVGDANEAKSFRTAVPLPTRVAKPRSR